MHESSGVANPTNNNTNYAVYFSVHNNNNYSTMQPEVVCRINYSKRPFTNVCCCCWFLYSALPTVRDVHSIDREAILAHAQTITYYAHFLLRI